MRLSRSVLLGFLFNLSVTVTGCGSADVPLDSPGYVSAASDTSASAGAPGSNLPGSTDGAGYPSAGPSAWQVEELPFAYDEMQQEVVIQLREEPRLQSPIRTVVGPKPQAYTLFFREPMNRQSVEAAILHHAREAAGEQPYVEPKWQFHWVHDQQLHLLAELPRPLTPEDSWMEYLLHVAGAKTVQGRQLAEETPAFWAVSVLPQQLWKISLDGGKREKLTNFSVSYGMTFADPESRYLLLSRSQQFCECDARYPRLYALYDVQQGNLTHYPVELVKHYKGNGDFVADRRGFFYAWPDEGGEMPPSEWATRVQIDAYVHGASLSHDRRHLLMAVGAAEQQQDLDLLIYDLDAGKVEQRLPGALQGTIPRSELDDSPLTVTFTDDGRQAAFSLRKNDQDLSEKRFRYDWKTGTVIDWNPPVPEDAWSGYLQSDDGMYQLYWNGGLYQGSQFLMEWSGNGVWIPRTHQFAYVRREAGGAHTQSLHLYDADRREERLLAAGLPRSLEVIGASEDGKWLYVRTEHELVE